MQVSTQPSTGPAYYLDKVETLRDIFGANEVLVREGEVVVDGLSYKVEDDVIIVHKSIDDIGEKNTEGEKTISSFSNEWESYSQIVAEHKPEFEAYFDIVDRDLLKGARCLDLGCGIGRWSYHVHEYTENLVLADASRAIFVARNNLRHAAKAIFIQADLRRLPFRDGAFDFLFCLGVLHHLEEDAIDLTRSLARFSDRLLIFLYYALDNRPAHFRMLLKPVDFVRKRLSKVRSEPLRTGLASAITMTVYVPLISMGRVAQLFGKGRHVPLYEGYHKSSIGRLKQEAYDRFFTPIEQRVSRDQIGQLSDTFETIKISPNVPYWHFLLSGKKQQ